MATQPWNTSSKTNPDVPAIANYLKKALSEVIVQNQQALLFEMEDLDPKTTFSQGEPKSPKSLLVIPLFEPASQHKLKAAMELIFTLESLSPQTSPLTDREMEVLHYLMQGKSYKTIAKSLSIGVDAVKYHLKNLYMKLEVTNKEDALVVAREKGWG